MLVKSYKKNNVELLLTQSKSGLYSVARLVGNDESNIKLELEYEDADDIFNFYVDMELEKDEMDCE